MYSFFFSVLFCLYFMGEPVYLLQAHSWDVISEICGSGSSPAAFTTPRRPYVARPLPSFPAPHPTARHFPFILRCETSPCSIRTYAQTDPLVSNVLLLYFTWLQETNRRWLHLGKCPWLTLGEGLVYEHCQCPSFTGLPHHSVTCWFVCLTTMSVVRTGLLSVPGP